MGQSEESLVTGSHYQIGAALAGTLTDAAHNELLGFETPIVGIEILGNDVYLDPLLGESLGKTFAQEVIPRCMLVIGMNEKDVVRTFRSGKRLRRQPHQDCH